VLYGYQWFFVVLYLATLVRQVVRDARAAPQGGWGERLRLALRGIADVDRFALIALGVAQACLWLPEVIYIKDIYGREAHRANTMFKFGIQGHLLMTVLVGFMLVRVVGALRPSRLKALWAAALCATLIPPMFFMLYAVPGYFLANPLSCRTLDGLDFVRLYAPDDAAIIDWLNDPARPAGNILEADGASFTYAGRISSMTGRATVMGWIPHEQLWRFSKVASNPEWGDKDVGTCGRSTSRAMSS
jgi:uncharacterized membrane protein